MKNYLTSAAIALIAATSFAGVAAAQNAVYSEPGALPSSPPSVKQSRGHDVDTMSTGSIYSPGFSQDSLYGNEDLDGAQDEGDYYDGALRPSN